MIIIRLFKAIFKIKYTLYYLSCFYKKYYENYSYEFEKNGESNLIKKISKLDIKVIFDVGANVGNYTKILQELIPKSQIHCFELSKETFKILDKNLNGGEGGKNIFLNNFGLSNKICKTKYKFYKKTNTFNSLNLRNIVNDKFKIKIINVNTGDNYCKKKNITSIDLLKIDVEGCEFQVLEGFKGMISQKKIKIIQFEYGYGNGDSKNLMRDFYDFLLPFGYKIGPLKKDGAWLMDFKYPLNDFNSGPNYIAILEDEKDIINLIYRPPKIAFANL
jgi:FkbM family methyltransferase